jgi:predicted aspartyl protease
MPGMRFLLFLCLAWQTAAFAAECKLVRIEEWAVRLERGLPVMDGQINGQKVAILLDTGTASSFVTRTAANTLGLARQESGNTMDPRGSGTLETTRIDELKIGPATRRNWNLPVVGAMDFGSQVSLVLGADFFSQVDVEFDLPNKAVRLFQARDCENASLAYWAKGGAAQVALERNPAILFEVSVNGRALRAGIDSGAEFSALDVPVAEQLGMTRSTPGVVLAGCSIGVGRQALDYWAGRFESFVIGDEKIATPTLRFADLFRRSGTSETGSRLAQDSAGLPHMLIGADFLRAHRVLVARSQGRVYFTYSGGTVFPAGIEKGCQDLR